MIQDLDQHIVDTVKKMNDRGEIISVTMLFAMIPDVATKTIHRRVEGMINANPPRLWYDLVKKNGRIHKLLYAEKPQKCMTREQMDEINTRLKRIEEAVIPKKDGA